MNTQPAQSTLDFTPPPPVRNPCHATGCGRACVPGQHMCAVHLAMFSRSTQDRILRK